MVVKLSSDDGSRMVFEGATCAMGGECGKEVMSQICLGCVEGQADEAMCGRMWWYCFRMRECELVVVKCKAEIVGWRGTLLRCLLR
jgi:hypothetical protein